MLMRPWWLCVVSVVICRTSTMTTGIYVRSIVVCRCIRRPPRAAPCCRPSPPGSCTSRRRPCRRRPVRRLPAFRSLRPRRRRAPGRRDVGGRRWGDRPTPGALRLPPPQQPCTVANITPSAAVCSVRRTGPDSASTADRPFAVSPLPLRTIPSRQRRP